MRFACRKTSAALALVLPALRKREHCFPIAAGYIYPSELYMAGVKEISLLLFGEQRSSGFVSAAGSFF